MLKTGLIFVRYEMLFLCLFPFFQDKSSKAINDTIINGIMKYVVKGIIKYFAKRSGLVLKENRKKDRFILFPEDTIGSSVHYAQLSGVQNGPAQEYKKTIPDKLALVGNLLVQNKAILAKKKNFTSLLVRYSSGLKLPKIAYFLV